jgi:hypothetical protein
MQTLRENMKPVGYLHEWEYPDEPGMVYREFMSNPPQSLIVGITPLYAIPEGWTVVPKEPSPSMILASDGNQWMTEDQRLFHREACRQIYWAMIAAVEDCG